jgi:hypothetical protein
MTPGSLQEESLFLDIDGKNWDAFKPILEDAL